jgi:dipeptidyl aminopeptidase/acylaminoacyl peptidase
VDGSNLHQLTSDGGLKFDVAWSPDGRYITYTRRQNELNQVYIMNVDGSNLHRLTNAIYEEAAIAWAPAVAQSNAGAPSTPGASVVATATATLPQAKTCTATASRSANVRSTPNVTGTIMDTLNPGQSVQVDGYKQGADGYIWYRRGDGFWIRGDMLSVDVGCDIPLVQP